jgi:hypothetical protein
MASASSANESSIPQLAESAHCIRIQDIGQRDLQGQCRNPSLVPFSRLLTQSLLNMHPPGPITFCVVDHENNRLQLIKPIYRISPLMANGNGIAT